MNGRQYEEQGGALDAELDAERGDGSTGQRQSGFESDLRVRMAQGVAEVRPGAVPYQAIVRQGRAELLRRRLAVAGAALVALAVVPATAIAFTGSGAGGADDGAAPAGRVVVTDTPPPSEAARTPAPPPGPTPPENREQLADGITYADAAAGLEQCLAFDRTHPSGASGVGLGEAAEYRLLLAHRSTGNDNSPGNGRYIVAVKKTPKPLRLICSIKNGLASGINTSSAGISDPAAGAVAPDDNGGMLYLQRLSTEGAWQLPFRWGSIGTVTPAVTRVTVTYGGTTVEAALDHGHFAATGILERAVTQAPRIRGYDARGAQVYDSHQDRSYQKTIP
ncbi:hypothetical protein OHA37_21015 [Streptomyces sp. NBC_00335]|uniref:hypothetical protein n=1 Tax=unclassified Streptomyces TaxID=2593676 RepID=UPI00224DDFB5|nr:MULTISPECIES: hypothetical protein [unclassified Streptomyces]MCX5406343.1 hypothetical protein [Streptomyces sp. NBC_00086]